MYYIDQIGSILQELDTSNLCESIVSSYTQHSQDYLRHQLHVREMEYANTNQSIHESSGSVALPDNSPFIRIGGGDTRSLLKRYSGARRVTHVDVGGVTLIDKLCIIIDYLKDVPFALSEKWRLDPRSRCVMHTESHAFIFLPGSSTLQYAAAYSGFTYTWVRDVFIEQRKAFWASLASPNNSNGNNLSSRSVKLLWDSSEIETINALVERKTVMGPMIFGDTNWHGWYFAFDVNPNTHEICVVLTTLNYSSIILYDALPFDDASTWSFYPKISEYLREFSIDGLIDPSRKI